jgi:hypothetical protein
MARRRWRPRSRRPRRRRGIHLSSVLLTVLVLAGVVYIARNQNWIHVGPGGQVTVPPVSRLLPPVTTAQAPPKVPVGHCDPVLMRHVYHPQRLRVLAGCTTVTGVIDLIRLPEPDGDTHVNVKLDPGQERLIHRPGVAPGSAPTTPTPASSTATW